MWKHWSLKKTGTSYKQDFIYTENIWKKYAEQSKEIKQE